MTEKNIYNIADLLNEFEIRQLNKLRMIRSLSYDNKAVTETALNGKEIKDSLTGLSVILEEVINCFTEISEQITEIIEKKGGEKNEKES